MNTPVINFFVKYCFFADKKSENIGQYLDRDYRPPVCLRNRVWLKKFLVKIPFLLGESQSNNAVRITSIRRGVGGRMLRYLGPRI